MKHLKKTAFFHLQYLKKLKKLLKFTKCAIKISPRICKFSSRNVLLKPSISLFDLRISIFHLVISPLLNFTIFVAARAIFRGKLKLFRFVRNCPVDWRPNNTGNRWRREMETNVISEPERLSKFRSLSLDINQGLRWPYICTLNAHIHLQRYLVQEISFEREMEKTFSIIGVRNGVSFENKVVAILGEFKFLCIFYFVVFMMFSFCEKHFDFIRILLFGVLRNNFKIFIMLKRVFFFLSSFSFYEFTI